MAARIQQMIPNQPSRQRANNHLHQGNSSPDINPRRIKLASVHSLKKSPQGRLLSPNAVLSPSMQPYQRLYCHSHVFGEGESRSAFLAFQSVVEAVEGLERVEGVESVRELENRGAFNGKQRCLVLTSTNDKSIKLVEAVGKRKAKMVDLILLGQLRPTAQYLSANVVLVTSDPNKVTAFLRQNGFSAAPLQAYQRRNSMEVSMSSSMRTAMGNLMRESEDSAHSPVIARRSNPVKEKVVHHWMVDKNNNGSFATTEISGEKVPPQMALMQKRKSQEGEESEVREYDQRELRGGAPIKNDEKNEKIGPQVSPQREAEPARKMGSTSENYAMNPRVYRHFPSNIITEVSDEYKGSVRESIMNIQPDLSFKSTRRFPSNLVTNTIADPSEDAARRAISGLNVNEYRRVESMVNQPQGYSYNTPTTATNMRHGSAYVPQTYTKTPQIGQQQGIRVIGRKQATSPQEVNAANIVNRVPISTTSPTISYPTPIRQQSSTQLVTQQYVPASYRAINSSKVSQIISSPALSRPTYSSPIDQLRNISNPPPPPPQQAFTAPKVTTYSSNTINWDDYEKIQTDGRTIYRKKVSTAPTVVSSQPQQATRQAGEVKTVEESKTEAPLPKVPQQAQPPPKVEESKTSKPVVSPRKSPPSQSASSPNILMLQSTLKPSPPPAQTIPTVKVSAPVPHKPQTPKASQLPPSKTANKKGGLETKPKDANKSGAKALMNESMFSRMSQLHSDGSILRRNNIRFGVKPPQPQQPQREVRYQPSMLQSKLSGIYKAGADARKNTLTRAIVGEEQLQEERVRLGHVITRFNCFHFIVQEELGYLAGIIEAHVATPNDRLEAFTGMEQLYERIRSDRVEGRFDAGFIFARKQEAQLVNPSLLPEDYYMVTIERGEGEAFLQVEQSGRRVRMDQLGRLLLAQRLVIDSKLYQYVAYRSHLRQIGLLADRFLHTQFILEQVETEFTSQILDFYYCELPRLTRLYLLCDEQQVGELVRLVGVYAELNPSFAADSCKIICILTGILTNQALIMTHPTVTFINNPQDIQSYQDVLRYAHHAEEDHRRTLPTDRLFFHRALTGLESTLEQRFPGRFLTIGFSKLAQVYARLDKLGKGRGGGERNYLVLHESLSHQRVSVQRFAKSFMVGKAKAVQPLVARVLNYEELMEVLGK